MSDELESILTESLQQRAQQVGVCTHGFGDVRRRVRRHRQRQMAAGLLPAVAGFGFIVTRQVAHDPLSPGGGASGCDTVPGPTSGDSSLQPLVATTVPWSGSALVDANGNLISTLPEPVNTSPMGQALNAPDTTIEVDANGNPEPTTYTTYTTDGNSNVITAPPVTTDANGNVVATSTTVACEVPTTVPPATTAPNVLRVLVVNASSVGGVAMATVNSFFPGAAVANSTALRDDTVVLLINPDSAGLAQYVAGSIGVEVQPSPAAPVYEEFGLTGVNLSEYDVVLVIGNTFANSFAGSPSTTAPQSITSSAG